MGRSSASFVQLALQTLSCGQKQLAKRLDVSETQITKWKQNESMSDEKEKMFRKITGIGDADPAFVLAAGSVDAEKKWVRLMSWLANHAAEIAEDEMGFNDNGPLVDEQKEFLCPETFHLLRKMGVEWPKAFPPELDFDYDARWEAAEDDDFNDFWDLIYASPHATLIDKIYRSFTDVFGFYLMYIAEFTNGNKREAIDPDYDSAALDNIDACLFQLAASKLDFKKDVLPSGLVTEYQFAEFKEDITRDYVEWINELKKMAYEARVPIPVELMKLVSESSGELGSDAEAAGMGFRAGQIHPDIYMNELLEGMRIIHQVLPAIMKKLGMTANDFKLNRSELSTRVCGMGFIDPPEPDDVPAMEPDDEPET
jgi:transcriptional regulator with XRE-family HTH domain